MHIHIFRYVCASVKYVQTYMSLYTAFKQYYVYMLDKFAGFHTVLCNFIHRSCWTLPGPKA